MKIEYVASMPKRGRQTDLRTYWWPFLEEFAKSDNTIMKITEFDTCKSPKTAYASILKAIKHFGFPMRAHTNITENAVYVEKIIKP